jgi:plasmid stabilization system protein ParE
MARRVVWTELAVQELGEVLKYWKEHNKSDVYPKKIRKLLNQNLNLIALQPNIGRKTSTPNVFAKLMLKNFFIIYKIGNHDEVVILNFWDCRQNPNLNQYIEL